MLDVLIFVAALLLTEPITCWLEGLHRRWKRRTTRKPHHP